MTPFDLCVIGAGPGGLSAAIHGARRGAKVCLVDPGPLGGTCLNRGCIPARTWGTTARLMAQIRKASSFGIRLEGRAQVDLAQVVRRKERILRRLRMALDTLVTQAQVTWAKGEGILQGPQEVEIRIPAKPAQGIRAKAVILATGSRPGALSACPVDGKRVITSDEILDLGTLPRTLLVVGAGVVGSEFASYFADLGVCVTLVEAADRVLPFEEERIAQAFTRSLQSRGVEVLTGTLVQSIAPRPDQVQVTLGAGANRSADLVLVAAGRKPQLPPGAEGVGIRLEKGTLPVDETLRTKVPSLYAIGDLLGEHQLACTASYEGALAAENALGASRKVEYAVVPEAIYTEPEIASVGLTPLEAKAQGSQVKVSTLSFTGFARAQTLEETQGFVQMVAESKSGRVLGVQMLGARATDLIGEAALCIRHGLTLQQLVQTLHGHPTMSESLWEVAAQALGQSIYYANHVS